MPLDLEPIKGHAERHDQIPGVDAFALIERVEELEAERSAVIDVLNIYGDEVLHDQLDAAGLLGPATTPPQDCDPPVSHSSQSAETAQEPTKEEAKRAMAVLSAIRIALTAAPDAQAVAEVVELLLDQAPPPDTEYTEGVDLLVDLLRQRRLRVFVYHSPPSTPPQD